MNKIFGIGLAKTATSSLARAMSILNFKSKHYLFDVENDLKKYEFLNDMPIQTRYKQYDSKYSNSKFILTIRDEESWLKSVQKQFLKHRRPKNSLLYNNWVEQFGFFGSNKEKLLQRYRSHNFEVKEYFKQRNDFLIMDIFSGDKWEKLCSFLNLRIPEVDFPHLNKSNLD
jgi:hypothetical protein